MRSVLLSLLHRQGPVLVVCEDSGQAEDLACPTHPPSPPAALPLSVRGPSARILDPAVKPLAPDVPGGYDHLSPRTVRIRPVLSTVYWTNS